MESKSYRGKARTYDPENQEELVRILQDIYYEAYFDLGQIPILMVVPTDFYKYAATSWYLNCVLPSTNPPTMAPAKVGINRIGLVLENKSEVVVCVYSRTSKSDLITGPFEVSKEKNSEEAPPKSSQILADIIKNLQKDITNGKPNS